MRPPLAVRKVLRPLVPDRVMSVIRLREHSRQVRQNVDVVVGSMWEARRWLATTPDTYRVRTWSSFEPARTEPSWVLVSSMPPDDDVAARIRTVMSDATIDAVVLASVRQPQLIRGRRTEPDVAPAAVAMRSSYLQRYGLGRFAGTSNVSAAVEALRAAGAWIALVPDAAWRAANEPLHGVVRGCPHAIVLALVPMHDVGGGSRGAQLTWAMLRRGLAVTYVSLFGTAESTDLGIRFIHPRLIQRRLDQFDPDELGRAILPADRNFILVEAPASPYVALAASLRRAGYQIVYDLIDDWTAPSLGGEWYDSGTERELVSLADLVAASAPPLRERLLRWCDRVVDVPNAVNRDIFGLDHATVPDDLPRGDGPLLGYHGSLYGDWFDWAAISRTGEEFPRARIVLLGDPPLRRPTLPPNVHLLGLRPQIALSGYLRNLHVGLLPFRVSDVTHAVSPLKVYEYLACGVPVAAPPLRSLDDLRGAGVYTDTDFVEAVRGALHGGHSPDPERVLVEHSWQERLDRLLDGLGVDLAAPAGEAPRVVLRPPIHHTRRSRLLTRPAARILAPDEPAQGKPPSNNG